MTLVDCVLFRQKIITIVPFSESPNKAELIEDLLKLSATRKSRVLLSRVYRSKIFCAPQKTKTGSVIFIHALILTCVPSIF